MSKRRVLIFSLVYYPRFVGGAEAAIKEITDRISPEEMEFDMVTLRLERDLPATEKIGNITVHRVGWTSSRTVTPANLSWWLGLNKYFFLWTGLRKALELRRTNPFNATWSLLASYNSFAALLFKFIHPQILFVFTLQDGDPIPYLKRRALPLYPLWKMIFRRADRITALSKYLAKWAEEMSAKKPAVIVPNGVDYEHFSKPRSIDEINSIKVKLAKKPGDVFLITTSRLVRKNGIKDIIAALPFLPNNVKLILVGTGPLERKLRELARSLNVIDRVAFAGHIDHSELPAYLHASDIFIRPSLSEGFGSSFIEAMAANLPVIATKVGGIADFLREGETGLFVRVEDSRDIAEKVKKLITDNRLREHIVRNAAYMVRQNYDWKMIAAAMKRVLD